MMVGSNPPGRTTSTRNPSRVADSHNTATHAGLDAARKFKGANMPRVLQLDAAGTPQEWLEFPEAAYYLAAGKVAWSLGDPITVLRGGMNAATGVQSTLALPPIMAIRGEVHASRKFRPLACERGRLFLRDRLLCAYCGLRFRESELTADHVVPASRGGPWSWTNLVTACGGPGGCNSRKADRTPDEARMPLLYVPYAPNVHEAMILENRRILADQMTFLVARVSANSRLRT